MAAKKKVRMGGAAGGFRLDATEFNRYMKELARKTIAPLGEVIEHEVLKVLQKSAETVGRTTTAKAGGKFNPGSKFFKGWVRMNGKFYYVGPTQGGKTGFKYSNSMWAQLMARMAQLRKRAETRVALSKAAFYGVAAKLRLKRYSMGWNEQSRITKPYLSSGGMGSPGKTGPKWARTFSGKKNLRGNKPKISFDISSTNTFNPTTRGAGKVQAAMNGRKKFFEYAVENDWRKTADAIARAYPNLSVGK